MSTRSRTPIPAPAGFKWVVSASTLSYDGADYLSLGLWHNEDEPDRHGRAYGEPTERATANFAKGCRFPREAVGTAIFQYERQIRRASKIALAQYRLSAGQERLIGTL